MVNIINGTPGNDTLGDTSADDSISGLGGNDSVTGGDGKDTILGGDGNDTINDLGAWGIVNAAYGEAGDDNIRLTGYLDGGIGNDTLDAYSSNSTLVGGEGNDQLYASGVHYSSLSGGAGDDYILANGGGTTISGGDGADVVWGTGDVSGDAGNDTLNGSGGATTLKGGEGNDVIRTDQSYRSTVDGGDGDDLIYGTGDLSITGGSGNDTVDFDGARSSYTVLYDGSRYVVYTPDWEQATLSGIETISFDDVTFALSPSVVGALLDGTTAGDSLTGTAYADRIDGKEGNDTLTGADGNDTIFGGTGSNSVDGGAGQDTLDVDWAADRATASVVNLGGSNGIAIVKRGYANNWTGDYETNLEVPVTVNRFVDTVKNVETIFFGGTIDPTKIGTVTTGTGAAENFTGAAYDDSIVAGGGHDTVSGGEGNDILQGGDGNDSLNGGLGNDEIDGGAGNDTLVGVGNDTLRGGDGNDLIRGETGRDYIEGGAGNDTIYASANNELYSNGNNDPIDAGSGDDLIYTTGRFNWWVRGGEGNDTLNAQDSTMRLDFSDNTGVSGIEAVVGSAFADSISGSNAANTLSGGGGQDTLYGNDGNDVLHGDGDNDWLIAGLGDDTLRGGTGNDYVVGDQGTDTAVFAGTRSAHAIGLDSYGNLTVTDTVGGGGMDILIGIENVAFSDVTLAVQVLGEGDETANGHIVFGGGGNDFLSPSYPWSPVLLDGGNGNDTLWGSYSGTDTLNGGAGNDSITVSSDDLVTAGDGNDTMSMSLSDTNATLTGGGGQDRYLYDNASGDTNGYFLDGVKVITDFAAGDGGDIIDLTSLLSWMRGYNGEGFASASVQLVQDGSDVLLQADPDAGSARPWETVIRFQNINLSALTAHNFGGYDPSGLPMAGEFRNGTAGPDTMYGGLGNDTFYGSDGDDYLNGGVDGKDSLVGEGGNDTIEGGLGSDTIFAGTGNDVVFENYGESLVDGGDGDDYLGASGAAMTVTGGEGNDTIDASGEVNVMIDAGNGNDVVRVWTQPGEVSLGDGQDIAIVRHWLMAGVAPVITDFVAGEGGDTLHIENPSLFLSNYSGGNPFDSGHYYWTQDGNDAVLHRDYDGAGSAEGLVTSVVRLTDVMVADLTWFNLSGFLGGTAGADNLIGLHWDDTLAALDGNDWVRSLGGNDSLDGGAGDDTLEGGAGNDTLTGGDGIDTAVFSGDRSGYGIGLNAAGNFTVRDMSGGLGGTDVLTGIEAIRFADKTLTPQNLTAGNDTASGDWLNGGDGDDVLNGSALGVPAILNGGNGNDTLTGSRTADLLIGGAGNDRFNTSLSDAAATMSGGEGIDTYGMDYAVSERGYGPLINGEKVIVDFTAGNGGDVLDLQMLTFTMLGYNGDGFGAWSSLRLIQDGADTLLQADPDGYGLRPWETVYRLVNVNKADLTPHNLGGYFPSGSPVAGHLLNGGDATDYDFGTIGHDTLLGGGGDDVLFGRDGRDSIDGDAGNDRLQGDAGNDTVRGGAGHDDINDYGGTDILDGGAGDDMISARDQYATITGGTGSDTISAVMETSGQVDAGAGNDLIVVDAPSATVILGAGSDVLVLSNWMRGDAPVVVTDFEAGPSGDVIVIPYLNAYLSNYTAGDDPFASGHFRWVQQGADAVLQTDRDGTAGSGGFASVLILIGTAVADLTAQNVAALAAGAGNDALVGADYGADTIDGLDGDDWISGLRGDDILSGGAGDDTLTGGRGDDLIDGGDGDDMAIFSGSRADYVIATDGVTTTVTGALGIDMLTGVETLVFDDGIETSNVTPVLTGDLAAMVAFGGEYVLTAGDIGFTDPDDTQVFFDVSNVKGGGVFVNGQQTDWFSNDELAAGQVTFRHGGYTNDAAGFDVTVTDESSTSSVTHFAVSVDDSVGRVVTGHEAGDVELISKNAAGVQANDVTGAYMGSADGRYVVFAGNATNLVFDGQNDGDQHVYRKDLVTGEVVRIDTADDGDLANSSSFAIDVSADGNLILFGTSASNLDDDGLAISRVFMKNVATGEVSVVADDLPSGTVSLAFNGNFTGDASKIFFSAWSFDIAGPVDFMELLYVRSLTDGTVEQLSDFNAPGNWTFYQATFVDVTPDGSKVLFSSNAPYVTANDYNGDYDMFVLDTATLAVSIVTAPASGVASGGSVVYFNGRISADGTKAAFSSTASDLTATDTGGEAQLYVKDLTSGGVTLISRNAAGEAGNGQSDGAVFSADGKTLYFSSFADNLVVGDDNGMSDIFAYDLTSGALTRVVAGDDDSEWAASLTPDRLLFNSYASNLAGSDANPDLDVFLLHVTGSDSLVGGAGSDTLRGLGGNDTMDGGLGNDKLYGGAGNDVYYVDQAGDQVFENANEGTDTVVTAVSLKAGANIERLTLSGTANNSAYGNALANMLNGNAGNNTLQGYEGNDTLNGAGGNDKLDGGIDHDSLIGGAGNDNLLGADGSDTLDGGIGNDQLNGGTRWDTLRGGEGDDILDGGADNDAMYGGVGNDTYVVDHVGDRVNENLNEGTDTVKSSIDFTLSAHVEVLYLTGPGNTSGTGNGLANSMNGNSANNTLSGGLGNDSLFGWDGNDSLAGGNDHDRLSGGNGNDTLVGGHGNDVVGGGAGADDFVFSAMAINGHDHISDFQHGLDRLVFTAADYGFAAGHALTGAEFTSGSAAVGTGPQFIWNDATDRLYFDADGSGAGEAFELAIVTGNSVTRDDLFFT